MSTIDLGKALERILTRIRNSGKHVPTEGASSEGIPSNSPAEALQKGSKKPKGRIPDKVYLKAMPLKSIEDLNSIKSEVESGNILIIRVSPLAKNSIEDVKQVVSELCEFSNSYGGDIARLGEERIVITPPFVRIWRERAKASEVRSTVA